jgi:hypothetical protein
MTSDVPAPIQFRLPEGWRAAPPAELGAPGAAFVALHPEPDDGFTANIAIDGAPPGSGSLAELADASVDVLRDSGAEVTVTDRSAVGSEAPGLTQTLRVRAVVDGVPRELVQSQVYLAFVDAEHADAPALVRLVLTATAGQYPIVLPDFQYVVWTVRPDIPTR